MHLLEGVATIEDVDSFVAQLSEIGDEHGCAIQAFDARYVADREHITRAVTLADRARERGEAIADDHGIEILLYAAGRRQINRALEMGVADGTTPVVAVVHSWDATGDEDTAAEAVAELLEPADTLGLSADADDDCDGDDGTLARACDHDYDYDRERIRTFFDVSERELAATDADLASLVRERVALLSVEK